MARLGLGGLKSEVQHLPTTKDCFCSEVFISILQYCENEWNARVDLDGAFVAYFAASAGFSVFDFTPLLTLVLIIFELHSLAHHDILWKKVNPSFETWWHTHKEVLS